MGRRSGHGASCSLGSTDIFCQTEGKQQPRLREISSPRARQGTLLPGLARAAANWTIIQKISTPTLGFNFSMHDVPSQRSRGVEGFSHHLPPKYLQKHLWESSWGTREDTKDTTQPSSPSVPFSAPHHHLPATLQCCPAWALVPGENPPKAKKKKQSRSLNGTSSLHPEAILEAHRDPNKSPGCWLFFFTPAPSAEHFMSIFIVWGFSVIIFFPPTNAASCLSGCWEMMRVQPAGSEVRVQAEAGSALGFL